MVPGVLGRGVALFRQAGGDRDVPGRTCRGAAVVLNVRAMHQHTKPPRARSAPSRRSLSRPASRRSPNDDRAGAGGSRLRETQPSELTVQVRRDLPRPLVSVAGELDLASAGLLSAMLDHVRRSWSRHMAPAPELHDLDVDVDLTRVTFADSHGLAPVLDSRTRIIAVSSAVRRLLLLLGDLPLTSPPLPPVRQTPAAPGLA